MVASDDVEDFLSSCFVSAVKSLSGFSLERVDFDVPHATEYGDLTTNVAMATFAQLDQQLKAQYTSPRAWASAITDKIYELNTNFEHKLVVAGPGFINIFLKFDVKLSRLIDLLTPIACDVGGQTYIVEYSSPNVAKPFTVGHLRSTVIGDAIANLLKAVGYKVRRDNHLGDWGTQFAKQIVAIEKWSSWEAIARTQNPIKEMVALYVRFHQEAERDPSLETEARAIFVNMEAGDEHYLQLWQEIVQLSLTEFERIYNILGVRFDENDGRGYGESFARDKTDAVVAELRQKELLHESEGAQVVLFPEGEKLPPFLILKKDGSTLYQTRDLAMDRWRRETYGPDIVVINEVGREQTLNFRQLYRVEEMLGWFKPGQRIHVAHGLYRFADRKMSTRKGEVVWLDDIIEQARARVREIASEELTPQDVDAIAVGAIKWNDLMREPILDITFDFTAAINLNGNCGPYMQYTACRAVSVLKKANLTVLNQNDRKSAVYRENLQSLLQNVTAETWSQEEWRVVDKIAVYKRAKARAAANLAPNILAVYLYELAQSFNNYYVQQKIGNDQARLTLTALVVWVLEEGLGILGIRIPEKM